MNFDLTAVQIRFAQIEKRLRRVEDTRAGA
jgi:hypothetical protein